MLFRLILNNNNKDIDKFCIQIFFLVFEKKRGELHNPPLLYL